MTGSSSATSPAGGEILQIRFHGRGGQGVKTASRVLGTALFAAGFEVQDAPRYGAERRGAPIFAYVRASRGPIFERGVITKPDLVVVVDDTVVPMPVAGVLVGVSEATVVLLHSGLSEAEWRDRLRLTGPMTLLAPDEGESPKLAGSRCVGAAAALLGVIDEAGLSAAVEEELMPLGPRVVAANQEAARRGFREAPRGLVKPKAPPTAADYVAPRLVDLRRDEVALAVAAIHAPKTSELQPTGLWRTTKPVLDREQCHRCAWLCGSYCPDGAIHVDAEGYPLIDETHCKGCMVCAAQCPHHAIRIVPEEGHALSKGGDA
ncbi:MAG: 2-oxoacid:acceptor oxidoreductase family protein [Myxococcales bacterium]|nr:2-oxoacid:acceptor oxidoreductase family protein [Myxococcales bacterium]